MKGLLLLLQNLPEFITALNRLGLLLDRFMNYYKQNNFNEWIDELEQAIDGLENSQTPEQKFKASHDLIELMRSLGPK